MYFALFSVGFGSALTFAQVAILYNILDLATYVEYRAVLNMMNNAAPFLCLGFDSAAPVLKRLNKSFPFFWNLILFQLGALIVFILTSCLLSENSKLGPLVLGLAASTSVSAGLILANHYRVEGAIQKYFYNINIADKLVRTLIILGVAYYFRDLQQWAYIVSILCFSYVLLMAFKAGSSIQLNGQVFIKNFRTSFPFIFASLGIVAMTRFPFYASYFFEESLITAKVDIWLLFSLFLLMPVLNRSKAEESKSLGLTNEYLKSMKKSWRSIGLQEVIVSIGIIGLAAVSILLGKSVKDDLLTVILPLMVGMLLIASVPNYVQLLCFSGRVKLGVFVSLLITIGAVLSYLPRMLMVDLSISYLFVTSALSYCLIGCFVANILSVKINDFWRWRDMLFLVGLSALILLVVDAFISSAYI